MTLFVRCDFAFRRSAVIVGIVEEAESGQHSLLFPYRNTRAFLDPRKKRDRDGSRCSFLQRFSARHKKDAPLNQRL